MSFETIELTADHRGVATLRLDRPEQHNALSAGMITELRQACRQLTEDSSVRCVILTGAGRSFCAGADLRWMQENMRKSRAARVSESAALAAMLYELDQLPKLLIGRINGQAFGGGVGMISVCDIAIGVDSARFALTEVRLGLLPANISPYVIRRIGARHARRIFLNGHRFQGDEAVTLGLLDAAVAPADLDDAVEAEVSALLDCAPGAVAATKRLISYVAAHGIADNKVYTADRLADAWETEESKVGIKSFFAGQPPPWKPSG